MPHSSIVSYCLIIFGLKPLPNYSIVLRSVKLGTCTYWYTMPTYLGYKYQTEDGSCADEETQAEECSVHIEIFLERVE